MVYLKNFSLVSENVENMILSSERRTYFHNQYPFRIFPKKELKDIEFSDVTILYGGNGSGKSTILNIIANKLNCDGSFGAQGEMQIEYLKNCEYEMSMDYFEEVKIIRSDDVFDYISNVRRINNQGFSQREKIFREYFDNKDQTIDDMNDYQNLKNSVDAKRKSASNYVRSRVLDKDVKEQSNGESALMYFVSEIKENSLYLLDEPENSMSAAMQLKLTKFLEESARFFNCQFIIATHSPFLLGMTGVTIYDLDSSPVKSKNFWELENMKLYYDFFKQNSAKFEPKQNFTISSQNYHN